MFQRIVEQWEEKGWSLYERYERHIGALSFIFGLLFDSITLTRVDLWFDNIVFIVHLLVVSGAIFLLYLFESGRLGQTSGMGSYIKYVPVAMQFSFGNLFSGFFVFYSRSASLATSWPFLIFLIILLAGNELFRKRYTRFIFHTSIFFIALFSYLIFAIPVLLNVMGAGIFMLSGFVALALVGGFSMLFLRISSAKLRMHRRMLFISIGLIYAIFNMLYFTNIIPPIPLSLKAIGVYHSVEWSPEGVYHFTYETAPRFFFFSTESRVFHRTGGAPVYVYSAIFAPTDLRTKVFHRWSYYDKRKQEWLVSDQLSFSIVGGRDGGWRGFTLKENIMPGKWRVDVITERDQLLGRITFTVVKSDSLPILESRIE